MIKCKSWVHQGGQGERNGGEPSWLVNSKRKLYQSATAIFPRGSLHIILNPLVTRNPVLEAMQARKTRVFAGSERL